MEYGRSQQKNLTKNDIWDLLNNKPGDTKNSVTADQSSVSSLVLHIRICSFVQKWPDPVRIAVQSCWPYACEKESMSTCDNTEDQKEKAA